MTTPEQIEQELKCADGTCGHHPQFDCDRHRPNPVLASCVMDLRGEVADLKGKLESLAKYREGAASRHLQYLDKINALKMTIDGYRADRYEYPTWMPIASAPAGYPALGEPSEWFLARGAQGPKGFNVAVIRRCFDHGFGPWECTGDAYYKDDFFTHWMPIPDFIPACDDPPAIHFVHSSESPDHDADGCNVCTALEMRRIERSGGEASR